MPFSMMSVSSCPARPTNASPCSSSSAPGPSPTNISSASGLPWPKTIVLRPPASRQRWQSPRSARTAARAARAIPARSGSRLPRRRSRCWRAAWLPIRRRSRGSCGRPHDADRAEVRQEAPVREQVGGELVALAHTDAGTRRARPQRDHLVEDPLGHLALRRERHVAALAVAPQQDDGVRGAAEARARGRDVVRHDQVEVLRLELARARWRRRSSVSAAKPTSSRPPFASPRPFRMSGVRTSSSRIGPSVFLSFDGARLGRAGSRSPPRPRSRRSPQPACAATACCISSAERTATSVTPCGACEGRRARDQDHARPAIAGRLGQAVAHGARRAVRDVAHRVDVLDRGPRRHQHRLAREVASCARAGRAPPRRSSRTSASRPLPSQPQAR